MSIGWPATLAFVWCKSAVEGNLWAAAGGGGDGDDGVHIFAPDGTRIGQLVLPEASAT